MKHRTLNLDMRTTLLDAAPWPLTQTPISKVLVVDGAPRPTLQAQTIDAIRLAAFPHIWAQVLLTRLTQHIRSRPWTQGRQCKQAIVINMPLWANRICSRSSKCVQQACQKA